ncbi:MAG: hypothetical protein IPM31_12270 [Anaerolineae bacterium]|nr:hypothetical protein [Anaerolineae bacterium]MCC7188161.1 hypothetical protein [Anaerolineales bacterium]
MESNHHPSMGENIMSKKESESTQTGKTEISIAKIGLITAVAVAFISCMGTVALPFFQYLTEQTTPTVEVQPTVDEQGNNDPEPTRQLTVQVEPTIAPATSTQSPPTSAPLSPTLTLPPPPTSTPKLLTSESFEAEHGEMSSGGFPVRDQTAVSASNQAYWLGAWGASVKFTITEMAAGQYELIIRYEKYTNNAEYRDPGYQNLYVNGNPSPILITTFKTFDDTVMKWADLQLIVRLEQGRNTLVIKNDVSDQVAGIDRLVLRWIGP